MVPRGARNVARVHPSSAGGRFMADGRRTGVPEAVLEVLGAHMAAKGVEKAEGVASQVVIAPADESAVVGRDGVVPLT